MGTIRHYDFVRARTCAEAVALLAENGLESRPIAGGTDLMVLRHKVGARWDRLVDVGGIQEMRDIRREGEALIIGAAMPHAEIAGHPLVREHLPALAQACQAIGSPQIRNRGTIGGNVANAAACADTLPALVCLGATARIVSPEGEGEMAVGELVTGVNRTALPPAGLIVDFRVPVPPAGSRQAFIKIGRRQAQSIARLSLACLGRLDGSRKVAEIRLTPGACTSQVQRFGQAEALLLGKAPSEELVRQAGAAAAAQMVAIAGRRWSTAYKEPALAAIVERALRRVFDLPGEK